MRANTLSQFSDWERLRISARQAFHGHGAQVPPEQDGAWRLPTEKDPYVLLARAVLIRALDDALLPETTANLAIIREARDFLTQPNLHADFWRSVAKV